MLNNVVHTESPPITQANNPQAIAYGAAMPPPGPIMGGVVPSTNFDFMSGPGVRERIAKAFGAA